MNTFGINRDNTKRYTEIINWREANNDNNSYIIADTNYTGSIIGLVDMKKPKDPIHGHTHGVVEKAILLRLNRESYENTNGTTIFKEIDEHLKNQNILEMDLSNIKSRLLRSEFPNNWEIFDDNINFKVVVSNNLVVVNNNSDRKRNYDLNIKRNFNHIVKDQNIVLQFESRLNCKKLFPINTNFTSILKKWIEGLIDEVNFANNISSEKFEVINYLLNEEALENIQSLTMNQTNMRKINAIFNRINLQKVRETLDTKSELIEDIKSMMKEVYNIIRNSCSWETQTRQEYSPESEFKVSIKGIDFLINRESIWVNVAGKNRKVYHNYHNYHIRKKNRPILDRALAYIISLGNEHELLYTKLEEKILKLI
ncbi:MAG: hypothetical protein H8D97_01495 [Proteobacteria bacterium]|nr:hypothetical protein [Pseudomonadota bacterium]